MAQNRQIDVNFSETLRINCLKIEATLLQDKGCRRTIRTFVDPDSFPVLARTDGYVLVSTCANVLVPRVCASEGNSSSASDRRHFHAESSREGERCSQRPGGEDVHCEQTTSADPEKRLKVFRQRQTLGY